MNENGITLEEISELCGVEPRTLRSWVSEGLLAPPNKTGRGARYPQNNATRALAVRALKEVHAMSLPDIRKRLMLADDTQIREWAAEVPSPGTKTSTAREYLSRIQSSAAMQSAQPGKRQMPPKHRRARGADNRMSSIEESRMAPEVMHDLFLSSEDSARRKERARPEAELANIERLLAALEAEVRSMPPRKARTHFWNRIQVTPDIELSIRGEMSPRERAMFEQMSDLIRTILTTGRADNDKND